MKIDIFGVKIDDLTKDETLEKIHGFLTDNKQHYIVLPYSEFIVRAQKDEEFRKILNEADLCLCESRGLYLVLIFLKKPTKEVINGIDLIYAIKSKIKNQKSKIFLLGGKEEIVKKTAKTLGDTIAGHEHGYQDLDKVVEKINIVKPEILLVGLGSPKQEKFIYHNLAKLPSVKLAIGVGGAFDFISSWVKRAPKFIQKIGLEWLWRLILEPVRAKRIFNGVIKFSWLILKCKIKKN